MALLNEIAALLVAQSLGTLGTSLFLGQLGDGPSTPDFATGLFAAPGQQGQSTHDSAGLALVRAGLEVLVRGGSAQYAAAAAHAQAIHEALTAVGNEWLSGTHYLGIDALGPPAALGRDAHNRPLFEVRMIATKEPS